MLAFTILTNDGQQAVLKQVAAMLRSAKSVSTENRFVAKQIAIPDANWMIEFESPVLGKMQESRSEKDFAVSASAERFNLSIFVGQPHGDGTSHEECYKFYWAQLSRKPQIAKETVTASAHDKYHRVQYDAAFKLGDETFKQRNVNYFFIYENRWVNVHISFLQPTDEDAKVIAAFDNSLQYKKKG